MFCYIFLVITFYLLDIICLCKKKTRLDRHVLDKVFIGKIIVGSLNPELSITIGFVGCSIQIKNLFYLIQNNEIYRLSNFIFINVRLHF